MVRHFLRDDDITATERNEILHLAVEMRSEHFQYRPLAGPKTVALLFDKPSTRTRVSFSVGVVELGGNPLILESSATQFGRGESIGDTTRVLSGQMAAIVWRTFAQSGIEEMARASSVPVINALTDAFHPCQVLADLLTILDEFGSLSGVTFAYLGDCANNMAHSYLLGCASAGMHVRLAGPSSKQPDRTVVSAAETLASESGGSVRLFDDAKVAADGAMVLATDTWVSMGSTELTDEETAELECFSVDQALMDVAEREAIALHCLPAYRDKEIASQVMDGLQSRVWRQSENRLHVQKALLFWLLHQASLS